MSDSDEAARSDRNAEPNGTGNPEASPDGIPERPADPIADGTADRIADHYDELDPLYRELWGEHVHHGYWGPSEDRSRTGSEREKGDGHEAAVLRLIERLIEEVNIGPDTRVADVGAGYGATPRYLADRYGADVTGITLSSAQHRWSERARAKRESPGGAGEKRQERREGGETAGRVELIRGDWLENAFPSQAFDLVLAIESISHMGDLRTCLREALRTLRPGGRFVAGVWCASEHVSSWSRRFLLEPIRREGQLAALRTPSVYESALRETGFRDVRFSDWTSAVRRTWRIVLSRMASGLLTRPDYRAYLFDPENDHRVFARAAVRIAVAQHLGALRYGRLVGRRPEGEGAGE